MKVLLALLVGMGPFCVYAQSSGTIPLNGIVARVNDTVITVKEVMTAIASELEFLERRLGDQPMVFEQKARELRANMVRDLVERQLILHEFKTGGYNFPESYIEDQIAREIRENYGDRKTLAKTLEAQGMTIENFREKLRERIILRAMVDHFVPRDPVISPFKIETYYKEHLDKFKLEDQVKLRMIVITNRPNDTLFSSKDLAKEIMTKLDEGAPFPEMARIYSQSSQSSEGGDWGWVEKSVLRSDLADVAFAMKPGQRSGVIERPDGAYILLVEETKSAHTRPLSEVRTEIENVLKGEETRRLHDKWIGRLKTKSFVQFFPD
jgi:peptidyl-prolyl cis-trans isomerase SurA